MQNQYMVPKPGVVGTEFCMGSRFLLNLAFWVDMSLLITVFYIVTDDLNNTNWAKNSDVYCIL